MQPYVGTCTLIHAGKPDLVPEGKTWCSYLCVMSTSVNMWCFHLEVVLGGWLSFSVAAVLAALPALYGAVLRSPGFQLLSMLVGPITGATLQSCWGSRVCNGHILWLNWRAWLWEPWPGWMGPWAAITCGWRPCPWQGVLWCECQKVNVFVLIELFIIWGKTRLEFSKFVYYLHSVFVGCD